MRACPHTHEGGILSFSDLVAQRGLAARPRRRVAREREERKTVRARGMRRAVILPFVNEPHPLVLGPSETGRRRSAVTLITLRLSALRPLAHDTHVREMLPEARPEQHSTKAIELSAVKGAVRAASPSLSFLTYMKDSAMCSAAFKPSFVSVFSNDMRFLAACRLIIPLP